MPLLRRVPTPTLHAPGIEARPPRLRDTFALHRCLRDPEMGRFVPVEGAYRWRHAVAFVVRALLGRWTGKRVDYLLIDADTGAIIGCRMAFRLRWDPPREAEQGIWIARPYWGRSLAERAGDVIVPYLFETVGLHRLVSLVDTRNVQAIKALEKSARNWRREGTLRHAMFQRGRFRDKRVYTLLGSDPSARPAPPPDKGPAPRTEPAPRRSGRGPGGGRPRAN